MSIPLFLIVASTYAKVQILEPSELHPHPVFLNDEMPKIADNGCYKPFSGTADKRREPFDLGDEPFYHGYELVDHVPDAFDIRNVDGRNLATPQAQQHMPVYCGGCWAFGTTSAIADRFKYYRQGAWPEIELSVQSLLNCGKFAGSCSGEGGADALTYMFAKEFGFVDTTCLVQTGSGMPCTDITRCMNCDPPNADEGWVHGKCYPSPMYKTYHVKAYAYLPANEPDAPPMVDQMKAEIFARGPISCQIGAEQMETYSGGILTVPAPESGEIDHIVTVSGWGREDGVEYWIVRNSWGTSWGENGWFRVEMHKNVMNLESGCSYGVVEWPPRVHTVPADRMVFTNGFPAEIPAWLALMEDSHHVYKDKDEFDFDNLMKSVEEQKQEMRKPNPMAGFAFKVNPDGVGYVETSDKVDMDSFKYVVDVASGI
eukprot:GHVH01001109.1.p1 GENE.GHVH01001109.1~~GHVH01001109.1.p1  ORF type:complete len:428 (-),score=50.27 GHVH01001109.1:64-1347(-)